MIGLACLITDSKSGFKDSGFRMPGYQEIDSLLLNIFFLNHNYKVTATCVFKYQVVSVRS